VKNNERRHGLYFVKRGMTSIFDENGKITPVTVMEYVPNQVLRKNGDNFVFLFKAIPKSRSFHKFKKPQEKMLEKIGVSQVKKGLIREQQSSVEIADNDSFDINFFQPGNYIDASANTKGKGFQGGIKRHGFKGGRASHGNSLSHRAIGSIGMRHLPSKTIKGRKMPGRMGGVMRTQQNLLIVKVLEENNALLIKGSIPGPNNSVVLIRDAVKI
jgi:large subunit ribosomal protein L3